MEGIACGLLEGVVPLFARSRVEYRDNINLKSRFSLGLPEGFDRSTGHVVIIC